MATASGSRDSRRRRIVDRGSDRLALITGRIQTLPSPPTSPPDDASSPPSLAGPDHAHISDGTLRPPPSIRNISDVRLCILDRVRRRRP